MPRVPTAFIVAGVFFAQAGVLLILVHFASPGVVFLVGPIAGLVGAGACLAARRAEFAKPASEEPWRLDAWGSLLAGIALPVLGWSVGPEAASLAWLLAALLVGLGTMALAGKPQSPAA
jgi:hypothetical protein